MLQGGPLKHFGTISSEGRGYGGVCGHKREKLSGSTSLLLREEFGMETEGEGEIKMGPYIFLVHMLEYVFRLMPCLLVDPV